MRLQMYLDPRVPQLKEVPTLQIVEGDPTEEGGAEEEAVAIDL